MAEYIFLGTFDAPQGQLKLFQQFMATITALDKMGIKGLNTWPTLGAFDVAVLVDAESELAVKRATLFAKEQFGINTTVLRCFAVNEALDYVQNH